MNKVNTKVDMRLRVDRADWLSEDLKDALRRLVCSAIILSILICLGVGARYAVGMQKLSKAV